MTSCAHVLQTDPDPRIFQIFLGLERYNLTGLNFFGVANPLVAEQSVKEIIGQLPQHVLKTLTSSRQKMYPCNSVDDNAVFFGSEYATSFVKDLTSLKLNEGWTVTYWSVGMHPDPPLTPLSVPS